MKVVREIPQCILLLYMLRMKTKAMYSFVKKRCSLIAEIWVFLLCFQHEVE